MDQISRVYGRSLFEVAQERDVVSEVREQLGQIVDALSGSRELQLFLASPQFSSQEKRDGLRRAIDGADPIVANLLDVMIENQRLTLLSEVRNEFDARYDEVTTEMYRGLGEQWLKDRFRFGKKKGFWEFQRQHLGDIGVELRPTLLARGDSAGGSNRYT